MLWNTLRISHLRKRESVWNLLSHSHMVEMWMAKSNVFLGLAEIWVSDIIIVVRFNLTISFFSFMLEQGLSVGYICLSDWNIHV